jgi:hypothetical protein
VALLAIVLAACGGDESKPAAENTAPAQNTAAATGPAPVAGINPDDFQSTVDNPYFPLASFTLLVYEGEEEDPDTGETIQVRGEVRLLPETKTVAGVEVSVIEDKVFEDGELVESTLDYYAQQRDGTVYYFGEDVDNYENGEIANHEGGWIAGEGDALPGIYMPADPQVGDAFEQERAPGIAEDRSTVIAVDQSVSTDAGDFTDCIETEDVNPLDGVTETKYYCRDIGFVREITLPNGQIDLVSFERA